MPTCLFIGFCLLLVYVWLLAHLFRSFPGTGLIHCFCGFLACSRWPNIFIIPKLFLECRLCRKELTISQIYIKGQYNNLLDRTQFCGKVICWKSWKKLNSTNKVNSLFLVANELESRCHAILLRLILIKLFILIFLSASTKKRNKLEAKSILSDFPTYGTTDWLVWPKAE